MSDPVNPEDRSRGTPADGPADALPASSDEAVVASTATDTAVEAAQESADAAPSDADDVAPEEPSPDAFVEAQAAAPAEEPSPEDRHALNLRLVEALLFASGATLNVDALAERLPPDTDIEALLSELAGIYAPRGVNLVKVAGGYAFRTAPDLAQRLKIELPVNRKLSRAAVETLAIIAYHQPVTRAEIEQIRGVGLSKGTLDFLFEQTWIHPMGRRRAPGKPVTWGTTAFFLEHFGLSGVEDLPGHDELKAAGLLDVRADVSIYRPDEPDLPLEDTEEEAAEPLDVGAGADKAETPAG
jgi:segregation and condensation protein B